MKKMYTTEGEKQAHRIEWQLKWMRYTVLPGACLAAAITYVFVVASPGFAAIVFILMVVTGMDEYWQRAKILNSEFRMSELMAIENRRAASVYVNGGFRRELKHLVFIGVGVGAWLCFTGL